MTPTWYDLLGVEPDATPDQIRAAWRSAIADLDPGARRFRTLNEAAEVLLDPERRAAYDRELAPEPLTRQKLTGGAERGTSVPAGSAETTAEPEARSETQAEQDSRTTSTRTVPAWLLSALAALTALMVAAAAYLATQPSDDAIAEAQSEAQGAAERGVVTILSYDHRTLDADQEAAGALMTPDYREKYDALFEQIKANAPQLQAVVSCEVVASGIIRGQEDRVQVLVFVNRPTTRTDLEQPTIYRDQVRMTMVESDGEWLVDDMETSPTPS